MIDRIENLVICGALRTPFSFGNVLKSYRPEELLKIVIQELIRRYGVNSEHIHGVVAGCINQNTQVTNIARIAALNAGVPETSVDYSIQANCNSGFICLNAALGEILAGEEGLYITAGVDSMSNYGYRLEDRKGLCGSLYEVRDLAERSGPEFLENFEIIDCLTEGLTDCENDISMLEVAEIMANLFGISREEQEEYVREKLEQAVGAVESGRLANHIIPLENLERDSYPLERKRLLRKPDSFSRMPLIFGENNPDLNPKKFCMKHKRHLDRLGIDKIDPTVTMYTSCIPGDGAGACLVTTEETARAEGLEPMLRIIGWAHAGVNPVIMGIGPMEAVVKLFDQPKTKRAKGLSMENVDIIEIHEAFASQVLSVFKESEKRYGMRWDRSKINTLGGSVAYTHPLGATNHRLITNILTRMKEDSSARYALATGCAGGGMGMAFLFERY